MAVNFTVSYDVPVRANYDAITPLSNGKGRDINGNSYTQQQLAQGSSLSDSFTASVSEGQVGGMTVGEILEIADDNGQALAGAFLLGEEDHVEVGGLEITLPVGDPNRAAYADAADPGERVWMIDVGNIVVGVSCGRDEHEIIDPSEV